MKIAVKLGAWVIVSVGLAGSPADVFSQAKSDPGAYARALPQLRPYCLGRLCLGTEIAEVQTRGEIAWAQGLGPTGNLTCAYLGFGNRAHGELKMADGRKYTVVFQMIKATGPAVERYRLTSIEIALPGTTSTQLDHLVKQLVNRWGPMRELYTGVMFERTTSDGDFLLSLAKFYPSVNSPGAAPQIIVSASFKAGDAWIMSLPQCQAGLPKL